jgi:hypothetical protein
VNQSRITAIAAGSPATPEEARELASMCQCRPLETCPIGEDVLFICQGERDGDQDVWINNGYYVMPEFVVDGWLPLPAAPNKEN